MIAAVMDGRTEDELNEEDRQLIDQIRLAAAD